MKHLAIWILAALLTSCSAYPTESDPFVATESNNAIALRRYLDSGGSPNAKTENGQSLLYIATGPHGGEDVVRLLLERGADPNVGSGTYSPLMNASSWCSLGTVTLIAEAGADLKARNGKGQTALQTVCSAGGDREEVLAYLRGRVL